MRRDASQLELRLGALMVQGMCLVEDLHQSPGSARRIRKAICRLYVDAGWILARLKQVRSEGEARR